MKVIFLGTGAAEGIPCVGCECLKCQTAREKEDENLRARSSLIISSGEHNLLIDTPPGINSQLDINKITTLSAILLSHEHFDHRGGLLEFEYWRRDLLLPIFAGPEVVKKLELSHRLKLISAVSPFYSHIQLNFGEIKVTPFHVPHHVSCYGFLFEEGEQKVVYFSDNNNNFSNFHLHLIRDAKVVIFNTPEFNESAHHLGVENVIDLAKRYSPPQIVITHINHKNYLHDELKKRLSSYPNIKVAYDGMRLEC
jgi:phosphoribosyl 1,2-cyclic phosphate phosphodiesterase